MHAESIVEKPRVNIIFTGMALFSMFFGAGNLIFPLLVGHSAGGGTPYALLGLSISAVIFPFLGLISMMLSFGDLSVFLKRIGKYPAFILLFILQITQGPLGCMPRLITLMHASVKVYLPSLSLLLFSLLISGVIFILTFRPNKIVSILGIVLTPVLLLTLATLVCVGMINAPASLPSLKSSTDCFMEGFKGGYQTMDLILALLFSTVIIPHLFQEARGLSAREAKLYVRKKMIMASMIAAGLLMTAYIGLCWIASHYYVSAAPEDLLSAISFKILGPAGGLIAIITIFFACLTTAISMATVFSAYVRKDLCKEKISANTSLIITLLATAGVACLGFAGIMRLLSPILEILYPGLILLCLYNIFDRFYLSKRNAY
ncbi:MAG: branched-chain amino acid transport system II carrier protein [Chlamydiota bacterium]